jgi:phosphonate transport system ATP-binding protein
MLTIEKLEKRYKTGDRALNGVSFTVDRGQVVGLIGPSGAGKSTLIRCINRLVEPTGGKVLLNGIDLTTLNGTALRKMRRRIGMIFKE